MSHTKLQMSPWFELMRRSLGGTPVIWLPRASSVRSGGGAVMCRRSLSSSSSLRRDDGSALNGRVVAACSLTLDEFSLFCLLAGRPEAKEEALQKKKSVRLSDVRSMHVEAHKTGLIHGELAVF